MKKFTKNSELETFKNQGQTEEGRKMDDFLQIISKTPLQKWHVKVIIIINGDFKLETIAFS